jgi:hypothetical protein
MTDSLVEAVEQARRDLRWATGGMTEEEKEEQRRTTEVKEMKLFVSSTFGLLREHALFYPKVIWHDNQAAVEFKIQGQVFRLCPSGEDLRLQGSDGKALTAIQKTDPNFASRVIVALGDALAL